MSMFFGPSYMVLCYSFFIRPELSFCMGLAVMFILIVIVIVTGFLVING